jgi:hypothetical protein
MKYPWQKWVETALTETAPGRASRIAITKTALYQRRQALEGNIEAKSERETLNAAIERLQSARIDA